MKRRVLAICLAIAGLGGMGVTSHGIVHAAAGGNSDAAHMCQQGGYLTLKGSDGTTFQSAGDCVSYVANGGTIAGVNTCIVNATTGCVDFANVTLPSITGTGNSITITGSISFASACPNPNSSGFCIAASFPNELATGSGTYVETDASGAVISQGAIQIADTTGSDEGLYFVEYLDASQNPTTACSTASYEREVGVGATLVDGTTGATQPAEIAGGTGVVYSPPAAQVGTATDIFFGQPPSGITIAC